MERIGSCAMRTSGSSNSQSNEEFRTMVERLPVLCWMADADGYIFYYNKKWYEYTGATPAEMEGWGWQAIHVPAELPRVMEQWRRSLASGEPFEMTFPLLGADGVARLFLTRAVPHRNADGKVIRWFGTNTEITDLQAAEARARESANILQSVIDEVPALVFVKDMDGRLIKANAAVLAMIGRTWAQAREESDADWFSEAQARAIRETDRRVIELGETEEIEEQAGFDEIGPRVLLSRKSPFKDESGNVIGLIGTSIDITDRKRAEMLRAEGEAHLRRVLDQLFAFVGLMTLDGVLIEANQAPIKAAGLKPEDVLGKPFWDAYWWSYSPQIQRRIRDASDAARTGTVVRFDIPVRIVDGEMVTIDFQIAPLRNAEGRITHLVPSAVVIEERVRLEQARGLLIRELHHRVKNLFAIAIGMVNMSARIATNVPELAQGLIGRLNALATAHELIRPALVSDSGDPGATTLDKLVASILTPHLHSSDQLVCAGPFISIGPSAVTSLSLILHELATNASKYGALSTIEGAVQIVWESSKDGRLLVLTWRERNGPPVLVPVRKKGFGSQLMEISAKGQLGGDLRVDWNESGIGVTLTTLLDRLSR
ncbi:MAG: hypothetical protein CTY15_08360 [Methylocystis sp.]|nr:MAG: hypothetical protein CTY15_08360 [Methylocystis sp.]